MFAHAAARNMCTCASVTCLHMLHAKFARVHKYVSSYGSSYRPTCVRNMLCSVHVTRKMKILPRTSVQKNSIIGGVGVGVGGVQW
jgi:hypothetical protein